MPSQNNVGQTEDLLLDKFEKVSLREKKDNEWWILRKTPLYESAPSWSHETKDSFSGQQQSLYKSSCRNDIPDNSRSYTFDHSQKASKRVSENYSKFSMKQESLWHKNDFCEAVCAQNSVSFMEDELYVKGHTVVWSRGVNNCDNLDSGRKTICAYTSSLPIKQAAWCTFYCEHPTYETDLFPVESKEPEGVPIPSICIIDSHNIQVFTQKGEDFITAIPFQISKMWTMKYGVFLEGENESL